MYRSLDDTYHAGTVKHVHEDGQTTAPYDDGGNERLNSDSETWLYEDLTNVVTASLVTATNNLFCITDAEPAVQESMDDYFKNRAFLKHEAQGFDQFPIVKTYGSEV